MLILLNYMIIELIDLKKFLKKFGIMCNYNEFLKFRLYVVECDLKIL